MGWFIGASGRAKSVDLKKFPFGEAAIVEAGQVLLSLLVVFAGANLLKAIGETFHGRHTYTQAFTAVAYGLSPLFLLRLLDAFSIISPWVSLVHRDPPVGRGALSMGCRG